MTKQAVSFTEGEPMARAPDALPASGLLPDAAALHFASPGFREPPAPTEFGAMPEVMPPPPERPVLPPDVRSEQHKPGLISRLLGGRSK